MITDSFLALALIASVMTLFQGRIADGLLILVASLTSMVGATYLVNGVKLRTGRTGFGVFLLVIAAVSSTRFHIQIFSVTIPGAAWTLVGCAMGVLVAYLGRQTPSSL